MSAPGGGCRLAGPEVCTHSWLRQTASLVSGACRFTLRSDCSGLIPTGFGAPSSGGHELRHQHPVDGRRLVGFVYLVQGSMPTTSDVQEDKTGYFLRDRARIGGRSLQPGHDGGTVVLAPISGAYHGLEFRET